MHEFEDSFEFRIKLQAACRNLDFYYLESSMVAGCSLAPWTLDLVRDRRCDDVGARESAIAQLKENGWVTFFS